MHLVSKEQQEILRIGEGLKESTLEAHDLLVK
jgi:hypothetical protein